MHPLQSWAAISTTQMMFIWETPKNLNDLIQSSRVKNSGRMCRRVDDDHRLVLCSQDIAWKPDEKGGSKMESIKVCLVTSSELSHNDIYMA